MITSILRYSRPISKRRIFRGDIYVFWIIAMPVIILILAMVIDLGRYLFLRGQVQTAADSAALAAASQIDVATFENGGGVIFSPNAYNAAIQNMNQVCAPMIKRGATCYLTGVLFDEDNNRVAVRVTADLSLFFPKFIPKILITMIGYSQVGVFFE